MARRPNERNVRVTPFLCRSLSVRRSFPPVGALSAEGFDDRGWASASSSSRVHAAQEMGARPCSQPNMQAPEDHRGALRVERQAHKPHKVHDTRPARPPRRGFCKPSLPLDLLGPRPAAACCRCLPCGLPASQLWLSCESAAADQGRAVFPFFFRTLPISDLDRVSLRDATRWQWPLLRPGTPPPHGVVPGHPRFCWSTIPPCWSTAKIDPAGPPVALAASARAPLSERPIPSSLHMRQSLSSLGTPKHMRIDGAPEFDQDGCYRWQKCTQLHKLGVTSVAVGKTAKYRPGDG